MTPDPIRPALLYCDCTSRHKPNPGSICPRCHRVARVYEDASDLDRILWIVSALAIAISIFFSGPWGIRLLIGLMGLLASIVAHQNSKRYAEIRHQKHNEGIALAYVRRGIQAKINASDLVNIANNAHLLNGHAFEKFVALLFAALGWHAEVTPGSGDGGVDVILRLDAHVIAVQCKQWPNRVIPPREVNALYGAGKQIHATGLYLVTTGRVSPKTMGMANGLGVTLFLHADVQRLAVQAAQVIVASSGGTSRQGP